MRSSSGADVSRAAAFAAALALHVALLAALLAARVRVSVPEEERSLPISLFLDLDPPRPTRAPAAADLARPRARDRQRSRALAPPAAGSSGERPGDAASITIDWSAEAARSAEREIAASSEADRQAAALASRARQGAIELDTGPPAAPEFRWSRRAEGRIQRTETGGTILWISERCMIVLSALMPICSLGKPPVNGELFEHLDDPPEMGDWKD